METFLSGRRRTGAETAPSDRAAAALHGGRRDRLVVAPNLWAGVGLVRGGADTFVLSGYPHLEESIRFAELVFPLLGKQAVTTSGRAQTGGAFDGRAGQQKTKP